MRVSVQDVVRVGVSVGELLRLILVVGGDVCVACAVDFSERVWQRDADGSGDAVDVCDGFALGLVARNALRRRDAQR